MNFLLMHKCIKFSKWKVVSEKTNRDNVFFLVLFMVLQPIRPSSQLPQTKCKGLWGFVISTTCWKILNFLSFCSTNAWIHPLKCPGNNPSMLFVCSPETRRIESLHLYQYQPFKLMCHVMLWQWKEEEAGRRSGLLSPHSVLARGAQQQLD